MEAICTPVLIPGSVNGFMAAAFRNTCRNIHMYAGVTLLPFTALNSCVNSGSRPNRDVPVPPEVEANAVANCGEPGDMMLRPLARTIPLTMT